MSGVDMVRDREQRMMANDARTHRGPVKWENRCSWWPAGGLLQLSAKRERRARPDHLADLHRRSSLRADRGREGGRRREQSTRDGPGRRRARRSSVRNDDDDDSRRRGETRVLE
jgi:hypothetical protein